MKVAGTWKQRAIGVVALVALVVVPVLFLTGTVHLGGSSSAKPGKTPSASATQQTQAKASGPPVVVSTTANLPIAIDFAAYYTAHSGAALLGEPVTAAFPTSLGLIQFFSSGALLAPSSSATASAPPQAKNPTLLTGSVQLPGEHVLRLPLVLPLLASSVTASTVDGTGTPSYGDLVKDGLTALRSAPLDANDYRTMPGEIFVATTTTASGAPLGHFVQERLWDALNSPSLAPDGRQVDVGLPVTEPLAFTSTSGGAEQHYVVQFFEHAGLLLDTDDSDDTTAIQPVALGVAYLASLGAPAVTLKAGTTVWGVDYTAVQPDPAETSPLVHVGMDYPLTLHGETKWVNGALWYHVAWKDLHTAGDGWVQAADVTFNLPRNPAWAEIDALSPDLAHYLAGYGGNASATVYDVTRGRYYTYNPDGKFLMASSAKVPIMLTFFTMLEDQKREPNSTEMYWLTTMIENSNNDSAQALFDEDGGAGGLAAFMHRVNVPGLNPDPDAWGYTTVTTVTMVRLLTLLHNGQVLNAAHRALALNLMSHVEADQQVGVGDTRPPGSSVALKDGWVQDTNYLWAMNTSGIVTLGSETYIIAVYTEHYPSLDTGYSITQHVCSVVGGLLT